MTDSSCNNALKSLPLTEKLKPLLDFGRLNEVSMSSEPIMFGEVAVPTEIFYGILDNFRKDYSTLAKCSRVCKSWFYGTRQPLFRQVYIRETCTTYLFYPFARSVRNAPEIRHFVRDLHLQYGPVPFNRTDEETRPEYNLMALANVISRLPNLETLQLTNTFWEWEATDAVPSVTHSGVKNLLIKNNNSVDYDSRVGDIVRWFPALKNLQVDKELNPAHVPTPASPLSESLNLETLSIVPQAVFPDKLLQDIGATDTINTVETFSYQVWQECAPCFSNFLRKAGHSIRHLSVQMLDERYLDLLKRTAQFEVLGLASCHALETLTLEFMLSANRAFANHVRAVGACLQGILAQVPGEKLHKLILRLDVANAGTEAQEMGLTGVLQQVQQLPALEKLVVVCRMSSLQSLRRDIARAFAPLGDKLEIEPFDDDTVHTVKFTKLRRGAAFLPDDDDHITGPAHQLGLHAPFNLNVFEHYAQAHAPQVDDDIDSDDEYEDAIQIVAGPAPPDDDHVPHAQPAPAGHATAAQQLAILQALGFADGEMVIDL